MRSSACDSCRQTLKLRLNQRINDLQRHRREYHPTPQRYAIPPPPSPLKSWYWDTIAPTPTQILAASNFFRTHLPRKQWTASEWRKQNEDGDGTLTPEVAFLGRSNVGKSSLLNALLYSPGLNHVGARPGKTRVMHAWGLSAADPTTGGAVKGMGGQMDTKVTILDAPGYGHASQNDWGDEIIKYLSRRKQLRRIFVLLDPLHGVKDTDLKMLDLLREHGISHQVIASKCDRLPQTTGQEALREAMEEMKEAIQSLGNTSKVVGLGEILAVGFLDTDGRPTSSSSLAGAKSAAAVQWAVLRAAGLDEFAVKLFSRISGSKPVPFDTVHDELEYSPRLKPNHQKELGARSLSQAGRPTTDSNDWDFLDNHVQNDELDWPLPIPKRRDSPSHEGRSSTSTPRSSSQNAIQTFSQRIEALLKREPRLRAKNSPPPPSRTQFTHPSLPRVGSIGHGLDDLLSMTGARNARSQTQPKRRSRKPRSERRRQPEMPEQQQAPPPPLVDRGPGVSRGIDALMAFTGADAAAKGMGKGNKAKRRG